MTFDRNGNKVSVGSLVEVNKINSAFIATLPDDEASKVITMLNEVFEVYEIDDYDQAWVEKTWHMNASESDSHSIALKSGEMEIVQKLD